MFDRPERKLKWLEQELIETEEEQFLSDFDPELLEALELTPEDLLAEKRRQGNGSRMVYADERPGDMAYAPPGRREKGVTGLVILAALELLGIGLIALWWIL